MGQRDFEWIEHEGEMGILAWGDTLEDLFQAAADGLYDLMRRQFTIREPRTREITLEADAVELLLKAFLSELVFFQSAYHEVYPTREFLELRPHRLHAQLIGGQYDPAENPLEREIKAVTYYRLRVWQANGRWWAIYVVDV